MNKILVTGGAGFIGSEFVRQAVGRGLRVVVVDKLTYAGDTERLGAVKAQILFIRGDITKYEKMDAIVAAHRPEKIVHFATETHVDRSILDARPFYQTNVLGTQVLADIALKRKIKKFIHISTDEVYGEIHKGRFDENAPLRPGNPYSASKAAADLLILAAVRTHKLPAVIVRPSNNYGPWQYPEKFIPVAILKALKGDRVPVYGRGRQRREWLYVADCCRAILTVMTKGVLGDIYNVSSHNEQANLKTAQDILQQMRKPLSMIWFVKDRPGHDFRYSLNCRKIEKLGWRPETSFPQGLRETVAWNMDHLKWLERKAGDLEKYWRKVYHPQK